MNLGTDGFVENVFHLLWTKEIMEKADVPLYLPDTVIFKYKQPTCWYFTSKNGKILKKTKRKLTIQTIEEQFLKNISDSGIVAYYVYHKKKIKDGEDDRTSDWKMNESKEDEEETKEFHDIFDKLGDIEGRDNARRDSTDLRPRKEVETVFELFDREKFISFIQSRPADGIL